MASANFDYFGKFGKIEMWKVSSTLKADMFEFDYYQIRIMAHRSTCYLSHQTSDQ